MHLLTQFSSRFEHMKNYDHLLKKVHGFLKPGGKLFVHIFTHKDFTYHFEGMDVRQLFYWWNNAQ